MRVLNFALNPYMLIPLVGIGIYAFLFLKIYRLRTQSGPNRWFLIYLSTALIAGTFDFFGSMSTTAEDATFWYLLFFVVNSLSFSPLFGFALSFTQHNRLTDMRAVRILLFVPGIIVSYFLLFTDLVIVHDATQTTMIHGMWRLTEGAIRGPVYFGWIQVTVMTSIILFLRYAKRVQDRNIRIQSTMYALALLVQTVIDIIILNILPIAMNIFIVPDGIVATFFLGSILAYGILKYNLFVINPATVASTIVNTMNEMLVVLNRDGNIEYVNHAVQTTLGYEPQDIVGKHMKILVNDHWDQVQQTLIAPVTDKGEHPKIKAQFYTKDGIAIPVGVSASAVKGDGTAVSGIVCVASDISQLIQLHDVTVQRDTLHKIIESLKDAVIAFDKNRNISIYNSAGQAMFEEQGKEIKGKNVKDVIQLYERDAAVNIIDLIGQATGHEPYAPIRKQSLEAENTSGKRTGVNMSITPVHDDAGLDLSGLIILEDLTKERELEEMKIDFVSIAAHELRTPITSVRGYLLLFLDLYGKNLDTDQSTMLRRADISAQRLSSLIDNLLSVSKIERGTFGTQRASFDWLTNVKQVVADMGYQANDKEIQLVLEEPPQPLPPVFADVIRVNEVLINLLSNAIAYTPAKGTVTIRFEVTDESVITHVQDTGHGIPKEAMPHMFTKFYRVSRPLEQGSKGTGLGLFISKSIIDMHKGKIWVTSEEGKGSTFSFSLPKAS